MAPLLAAFVLVVGGCAQEKPAEMDLLVPRGYMARLEINLDGRLYGFGPFVGYYFKPDDPADLSRLRLVCFNEERFYTKDLPRNAKLFEGEAVLATLPETGRPLPSGEARIQPVFFSQAPPEWLETRPAPQDEFLHFHSLHDAQGPARHGYWLRHVAVAAFTYDMGGRVGPDSPLHHEVRPGVDRDFAKIVEFDRGAGSQAN